MNGVSREEQAIKATAKNPRIHPLGEALVRKIVAAYNAALQESDDPFDAERQAEISDLFSRAAVLLTAIKAVVDEPLDERDGHGPTRQSQFARIEQLVRDLPHLPPAPEHIPAEGHKAESLGSYELSQGGVRWRFGCSCGWRSSGYQGRQDAEAAWHRHAERVVPQDEREQIAKAMAEHKLDVKERAAFRLGWKVRARLSATAPVNEDALFAALHEYRRCSEEQARGIIGEYLKALA